MAKIESKLNELREWLKCPWCKGDGEVLHDGNVIFCQDCGGTGKRLDPDKEELIQSAIEESAINFAREMVEKYRIDTYKNKYKAESEIYFNYWMASHGLQEGGEK
jgi:hypothetical protein